jgi:Mg2+-importing ATPase
LIVLVIRSRRPFFKSMPGKYLLMATLVVAVVTVVLPYLRIAGALGFQPLPGWFVAVVFGIILPYVAGAEIMKRAFYKRAMGQGQERRRSQGAGRR